MTKQTSQSSQNLNFSMKVQHHANSTANAALMKVATVKNLRKKQSSVVDNQPPSATQIREDEDIYINDLPQTQVYPMERLKNSTYKEKD